MEKADNQVLPGGGCGDVLLCWWWWEGCVSWVEGTGGERLELWLTPGVR